MMIKQSVRGDVFGHCGENELNKIYSKYIKLYNLSLHCMYGRKCHVKM